MTTSQAIDSESIIKKTAVIVCNGEAPPPALLHSYTNQGSFLVGVDGGTRAILEAGLVPHLVTGDGDSLPQKQGLFPFLHTPDAQENDLCKCLRYLIEQKHYENIIVLGALGKRIDHALGNLFVLARFQPRETLKIVLIDHYVKAWVAPYGTSILLASEGTAVSFFALGKEPVQGLTLSGVAYPLKGATLSPGSPEASLNHLCEPEAQVLYQQGCLLIIQSCKEEVACVQKTRFIS